MAKKFIIVLLVITAIGFGGWRVLVRRNENTMPGDSTNIGTNTDKPRPSTVPEFDKAKYPTDKANSIWLVANKSRPLNPLSYVPNDLADVGNGQYMRREAATALQALIAAAAKENLRLSPLSGYRSYQTQQAVYANEVAAYGQTVADTQSAKPGYSEHQSGWSLDMGGGGCGIEDCFARTNEGKWLAGNAYKYGFVIRYPEGKQSITGYRYEPWHIRYVGKDLAGEMKRTNISTLEEFFEL